MIHHNPSQNQPEILDQTIIIPFIIRLRRLPERPSSKWEGNADGYSVVLPDGRAIEEVIK
jgi:hypothetical protein